MQNGDKKPVRKKNPDDDEVLLDAIDTILRSSRFGSWCDESSVFQIWDDLEAFRLLIKQGQV